MKQERYLKAALRTSPLKCNQFLSIEANMVGSVFCANQIKACISSTQHQQHTEMTQLTADQIWELHL